jgi:hypothetical protein
MEAVAHSKKFAKKVGVPMSVGKDFAEADKGKKFRKGGTANPVTQGINKQKTHHGSMQLPNAMLNKYIGHKEGGMATEKMHSEKSEMKSDLAQDKKMIKKAFGMHDKQLHEKKKTDLSKLKGGGMARMTSKGEHPVQKQSKRGAEIVKMAKGGLASGHKSADGIAVRGKTRALVPAMCGGGYMKKGK